MKKFTSGPVKTAFADAKKLIEEKEPEIGSDFFRLLEKAREAFTDAAQVKEILKIRTDKTARQRLLDTYEAMLGFMQLADVDPREVEDGKKKTA